MMKTNLTIDTIRSAYLSMDYEFFENKPNIFGIRDADRVSNRFNDLICWTFKMYDEWKICVYKGTTDPGETSLKKPVNYTGCAILVPGQYLNAYGVGLHKGKYEALCQINGPVRVFRDNTHDSVMDFDSDKIQTGYFGINIHRANANNKSILVDNWSAGCQVISDPDNFSELMNMAHAMCDKLQNKFTYTLFTEEEFYG